MDPLFHLAHFAAQAAAFCITLLILCFFLYRSLVRAGHPAPITPPAFEARMAPKVSPTAIEWRSVSRGVTPEFYLPSFQLPNDSPTSSQDTKVASMGSPFTSGDHPKHGSDFVVIKAPTIRKAEFMKRRLSSSVMSKTHPEDKEDTSEDDVPLAQGLLKVSNETRAWRGEDVPRDGHPRIERFDDKKKAKQPTLSTVDWTNRQSALAFMSVYDSPNDGRTHQSVSTPSGEMDDFFVYRSSDDFIPTFASTPPNLRFNAKQSSTLGSVASSPDFLASPFCARSRTNGYCEDERVQSYFKFNLSQSLGMSTIAESMGRLPGDLAASFIVAYHNKRRDEEFRSMYGSF